MSKVGWCNFVFEILYIWFHSHIFYTFSTFPRDWLNFPSRRYPSFRTSSPSYAFQPDFSPKLFLVAEKFRFLVFRNPLIWHLSWFLHFRGAGMLFLSLFELVKVFKVIWSEIIFQFGIHPRDFLLDLFDKLVRNNFSMGKDLYWFL